MNLGMNHEQSFGIFETDETLPALQRPRRADCSYVQCSAVQPARYVVTTIRRHEQLTTIVHVRRGDTDQLGT